MQWEVSPTCIRITYDFVVFRFSVFEDYCIDVTLKERETRQSALQQVEKTIMCVDTQHSRLFDMDLTIHEMARLAQKSKKKHNADYSSTTLPRNK